MHVATIARGWKAEAGRRGKQGQSSAVPEAFEVTRATCHACLGEVGAWTRSFVHLVCALARCEAVERGGLVFADLALELVGAPADKSGPTA